MIASIPPVAGFVAGLFVSVALLGGVVVTGLRAQRRRHIPLVVGYFVALGITIWFAERLGDTLDLEAAGAITPIHLTLAKITTVAYLLPITTGLLTLRDPRHRKKHRAFALLLLLMTVATVVTGLWMVSAA